MTKSHGITQLGPWSVMIMLFILVMQAKLAENKPLMSWHAHDVTFDRAMELHAWLEVQYSNLMPHHWLNHIFNHWQKPNTIE